MFPTSLHPFQTIFQSIKLIPVLCSSDIKSNSLDTKICILVNASSRILVRAAKNKFFYANVELMTRYEETENFLILLNKLKDKSNKKKNDR